MLLEIKAQPNLDIEFNGTGTVVTDISTFDDHLKTMLIQPNGKIIVAGEALINQQTNNFALIRYNTNGTLDSSFGINGIVTTSLQNPIVNLFEIALQPDGKIIAVGFTAINESTTGTIIRYNEDGTIDTNFGTNGIASVSLNPGLNALISVVVKPDSSILVTGTTNLSKLDVLLMQFKPNGTLDTDFNTNGIVTIDFGNSEYGTNLLLLPNNKILIVGTQEDANNFNTDVFLIRLNSSGKIDSTFGNNGHLIYNFGSDEYARNILLQPDGKIIIAFNSYDANYSNFNVLRCNQDGSLDSSFANNGIASTDFDNTVDEISEIALQSNGKIVAIGKSSNDFSDNYTVAMLRYNNNGTLDSTFDTDGKLYTAFSTDTNIGVAVQIQSDGKIVIAGETNIGSNSNFAVARYNADEFTGINYLNTNSINSILSPNPANNNIYFTNLPNKKIITTVYNLMGKKVQETILSANDASLNIKGLSKGVYIFELKNNNGDLIKTGKFLK